MSSRSGNFIIHLGTQYYTIQWIQDELGLQKRVGGRSREGAVIASYLADNRDDVTIFKTGVGWCISPNVIDNVVSDVKELLGL